MKQLETKKLGIGEMQIYDFGDIKLHAYETNDALADESFLLETKDILIGIEAPAFHENLKEFSNYIENIGKPLNCVLISYHPAGGEYFKGIKIYGTKTSNDSINSGSTKSITERLANSFGEAWDKNIIQITDIIENGKINISGIDFNIIPTNDGYDIEIRAINSIYTHMLGKNIHSIISSTENMDYMITTLKGYQSANYNLILSSHHTPETLDAVIEKINYIQKLKEIYRNNSNANGFINEAKASFPNYTGENYLDMTAGMLYN